MKNSSIITLAVATVVLTGCFRGAPAVQTNQQAHLGNDVSHLQTETTLSDPEQLKAWNDFNNQNHFRIANADDFKFSISNKPKHDRFWYGSGNFNQDRLNSDFALVIVELEQKDELRFGLVIFNARDGGYDDPLWLYRYSDLSRVSLNTTSHGPLLIANHDDEAVHVCTVKWNRAQEEYTCN